jgi:hypothetical protein
MVRIVPLLAFSAGLLIVAPAATQNPKAPGTVSYTWLVRWPRAGQDRASMRAFKAPPGLIRRVELSIAGRRVASPPQISTVGCVNTPQHAAAQRSWLWNGRTVYVALLLSPGRCTVAGTLARVRVTLTSVGT